MSTDVPLAAPEPRAPFAHPDHDSRVEHDHEQGVWRAVCSCGTRGDNRPTVDEATGDRFAHELEVEGE